MNAVIADFPNYTISKDGQVLSKYTGKWGSTGVSDTKVRELKHVLDKGVGYYIVTLCHEGKRRNQFIHRLLAIAFIPNPDDKPHVNHIDGNKQNNELSNLEWNTAKENTQHAIRIGLCNERRKAQEVTILQYKVDKVTFLTEHVSIHEAGRTTGVAWQNISKVVRGIRHTAGGFHWKYKKSSETIL